MFKLYVIPTREDQLAFDKGKKPGNVLTREFATDEECGEYKNGLEAVYDLAEYSIEDESPTSLTISFDDDEAREYNFDSEAEKDAYKTGLEDGEGFETPLLLNSNDDPEEYARLDVMMSA